MSSEIIALSILQALEDFWMNEFIAHRHRNLSKRSVFYHKKHLFGLSLDPAKSLTPHSYTLVYFLGYNGVLPQNLVQNDSQFIVHRRPKRATKSWKLVLWSQGVPTTLNFVLNFITQLCQAELMVAENIIFSGKGMGGHMALFCQQEFKSVASIVHNPTTNLVSSKYVEETNASLFRDIFSKSKTHDFQNLVKLIEKTNHRVAESSSLPISTLDPHFTLSRFFLFGSRQCIKFRKNQLFFDAIFRLIDDTLSPVATKFEIVRKNPPNPSEDIHPIHIKISSRPEVCIDKDLTFDFDPYEDRSWRFWYQNLCWLEEHLSRLKIKNTSRTNLLQFFQHGCIISYQIMDMMRNFSITIIRSHTEQYISWIARFAPEGILADVKSHIRDIGTLLSVALEDNSLSNHAYDQAVSLFLISYQLDGDDECKHVWEKVALERLKEN